LLYPSKNFTSSFLASAIELYAIHADPDVMVLENPGKCVRGELTPLVFLNKICPAFYQPLGTFLLDMMRHFRNSKLVIIISNGISNGT